MLINSLVCWFCIYALWASLCFKLVTFQLHEYHCNLRTVLNLSLGGMGIAQWLGHQTRDQKVAGSNRCRNGGRIFSRVNFLCWLLFRYLFHPRVIAVARKRPRSFCQKCRWQVTAKDALYVCGFAWSDMVHSCMVYAEHTEMAAVSCGTSQASTVSTPLRWIFKNAL